MRGKKVLHCLTTVFANHAYDMVRGGALFFFRRVADGVTPEGGADRLGRGWRRERSLSSLRRSGCPFQIGRGPPRRAPNSFQKQKVQTARLLSKDYLLTCSQLARLLRAAKDGHGRTLIERDARPPFRSVPDGEPPRAPRPI